MKIKLAAVTTCDEHNGRNSICANAQQLRTIFVWKTKTLRINDKLQYILNYSYYGIFKRHNCHLKQSSHNVLSFCPLPPHLPIYSTTCDPWSRLCAQCTYVVSYFWANTKHTRHIWNLSILVFFLLLFSSIPTECQIHWRWRVTSVKMLVIWARFLEITCISHVRV